MSDYHVVITEKFTADVERAIARKREFGTYESNIEIFKNEIKKRTLQLKTSPKSGSNLSARVDYETNDKLFIIDDYLMIYEITGKEEVTVYRLLSAKSNWQRLRF